MVKSSRRRASRVYSTAAISLSILVRYVGGPFDNVLHFFRLKELIYNDLLVSAPERIALFGRRGAQYASKGANGHFENYRDGPIYLNSFEAFAKWVWALVMPQHRASAVLGEGSNAISCPAF